VRLSSGQLSSVSDSLTNLMHKLPSDFARQPRSLTELERWKATEFRHFMLYTGPVVLKKVVSDGIYEAFMEFSVALTILLTENNARRNGYLPLARQLLGRFVRHSRLVFSEIFTVYNVHNLLHIADDVEYFQCSLNAVSSFPFENHLFQLKRTLRSSCNPLVQVWKRINDLDGVGQPCLGSKKTWLSAGGRDSVFLLKSQKIAFVKDKLGDGQLVCDIVREKDTESFFTSPCDSKLLDIQLIRKECRRRSEIIDRRELLCKFVAIPYGEGYVVFPMLHH